MAENNSYKEYEAMFGFDKLAEILKDNLQLKELCLEKHAMMKQIYDISKDFHPLSSVELGFIQSFEQFFIDDFINVIKKNKNTLSVDLNDDFLDKLSSNIRELAKEIASKHPQPSNLSRGIVSSSDSSLSPNPRLMSFYGHADLELIVAKKFKHYFLRSNQPEYVFTIHSVPPPSNPRKETPAEDEEPIAYAKTAFKQALKWCKDPQKIKIIYNNGVTFRPSESELKTWLEESKNGPDLSKMAEETLTKFIDCNEPAINNHPRLFKR